MTSDYSVTPKKQTFEGKNSVQDFKIEHFNASNDINTVKKQPRDWEITWQIIYLIRDLTHNILRLITQ